MTVQWWEFYVAVRVCTAKYVNVEWCQIFRRSEKV